MKIAFRVSDAKRNHVHVVNAGLGELARPNMQLLVEEGHANLALDGPAQETNFPSCG